MPQGLAAALPAIIGGVASAGAGVLAANKARKQSVEDQTRWVLDPVEIERKKEEDIGSTLAGQPSVTLRPGGRPIVFRRPGSTF